MSNLNNIKKTASELKKENIKGANYIVLQALSSLSKSIRHFKKTEIDSYVEKSCKILFQAQPTMAPLANCMALILDSLQEISKKTQDPDEVRKRLLIEIQKITENYRSCLKRIVQNASPIIQNNSRILTYSFSSTVFETLKHQKKLDKNLEIFITESRPNNEGLLGAKQLAELYPTTLFIDAGVGYILKENNIDLILIGADAFTNTELIHKIGTLPLALTAREFQVPIYVLANSFKYHTSQIPIKAKPPHEIAMINKKNLEVKNYYFDRTPIKYLNSIITEEGIHDIKKGLFSPKITLPVNLLKRLHASISRDIN